ncbi:hypothetical protein DFH06DRAFT_1043946 [Mycena polygramma]|nr:hypothetical protein DFH06DRAFT_1043946 [Mycena polygramma]
MPSFVQNIDITSPLIQYSGPWMVGGADGDPEVVSYDQHTFVYCAGVQCSATIRFTGSEVHVVGAYRKNSGPFQVVLDNVTKGPFKPPGGAEEFQIDLFNQANISSGPHTLNISNLTPDDPSKPNMNLDHITWTTSVNSLTDLKIQDDNLLFSYDPSTSWRTDLAAENLVGFDAGTGHFTSQTGATASLTFVGDRVAVYGAIGTQGSLYTAQLDDAAVTTFSGEGKLLNSSYLAGQMIFYANNLPAGHHTLRMAAVPTSGLQLLSVDYAIVDGTLNPPSIPASASSGVSGTSRPTLSAGALGGIVSAVTIIVIGLMGGGFYLCRRRQRARLRDQQVDVFGESIGTHGAAEATYGEESTQIYSESDPPRYEQWDQPSFHNDNTGHATRNPIVSRKQRLNMSESRAPVTRSFGSQNEHFPSSSSS